MNLLVGTMIVLAALAFSPPAVEAAAGETIIISEIMYDPLTTEVDSEWVELHNPGIQAVNVLNWSLLDQDGDNLLLGDVDFVFPDIDFPPLGYALIHTGQGTNSTSFVNGKADFYMWKGTSIWSPTADDCLLTNSTNATIDYVSYGQWGASTLDPPPLDFNYAHNNASAEEGFTVALADGELKESVPTPLEFNGHDIAPALLITEVYYDTWGENEYVKIFNPGILSVNVSHWRLTDGDGLAAFPCGIEISPGQTLTIAQNSTNFQAEILEIPDCEYWNEDDGIPDMDIINKEPQFANDKGEVFLLNTFGTQIDAFAYGGSDYEGVGWTGAPAPDVKQGNIAKRLFIDSFADSNTSADWLSQRPYVLGQSNFQPAVFSDVGPVCLFSSPDSSFEAVCEALDNATQYIWLNLYEFINTRLCDKLLDAIGRGVSVRLFLEGSPVGGMNETQLYIARQIVEAGGLVRILTNDPDNDIHARYDYDHGKYAVIDDDTLLIMSENWGWTGVPPTGWSGNRGWGAVLSDAGLAGYFKDVFEHDWNPLQADSVPYDSSHSKWNAGHNWSKEGYDCEKHFDRRYIVSNSVVTPVLSPDTSLSSQTILGMLNSAQERVCVEEFYIYKHWGSKAEGTTIETPNIYLEAVIDAARRGCEVRVLMDASYYNIEPDDPIDNDNTAEYINGIALAEGLEMEAKVVNLAEHDFGKIHNKGLIADNKTLISSINWNKNSATENRETGIIIDNSQVANFFMDIFEYDWMDDTTPPVANFSFEQTYMVNTTIQINATESYDNVGIVNYTWVLDNNQISWGMNFSHNFTMPGLYSLNLTVLDAWKNNDSAEHVLNVTALEVLDVPNNETENGTSNETLIDDNNNNNNSVNGNDNTLKAIGILLLVPLFIFIAAVYILRIRNK